MKYAMLVGPAAAPDGAARLEVPDGATLDGTAGALDLLFATRPALDRVVLVVDGTVVGISTRAHLSTVRALGVVRGAGEEDRGRQPVESTQYTVLTFRCPSCERTAWTAFYDERYRPRCEADGHGAMELR
ncbi:hypothetical protein ACFUJ0_05905 [Streptomyces sp. NPDC057242]|uniref:hypothetical protein n=1 Tax=Streptomyces TaxID=1883 RepID=UPI0035E1C470